MTVQIIIYFLSFKLNPYLIYFAITIISKLHHFFWQNLCFDSIANGLANGENFFNIPDICWKTLSMTPFEAMFNDELELFCFTDTNFVIRSIRNLILLEVTFGGIRLPTSLSYTPQWCLRELVVIGLRQS